MKVWEVMSINYHKVRLNTLITEARAIFRKHDIRILVIVRNFASEKLEGYILRRDVLTVTSARSNLTVREVLREEPVLLPDMDIREAFNIMSKSNVDAIPVVKSLATRQILGIVTLRDIIAGLKAAGYIPRAQAAGEVMTIRGVPLLSQNSRITKAWRLFVHKGVHGIIVVSDFKNKKPVGIITPKDMINSGKWYFHRESEKPRALTRVKTVMTRGVIVAYEDTPIEIIADYMIKHDFSLVPVIDEKEKIVGAVTQYDVLRAYLEGRKPERVKIKVAPAPLMVSAEESPIYVSTEQQIQQVLLAREEPSKITGLMAGKVLRKELPAVRIGDTVETVVNTMLSKKVNYVIVVNDEDEIIGVVTKKELLNALGLKGPIWRRRPREKEFIYEIIKTDIPKVEQNATIEEIAREMIVNDVYVVIVEKNGNIEGFVTKDDLVKAFVDIIPEDLRVEHLMTPAGLGIVHPHHSLAHAVRKMRAYYLDALAVADKGTIYGVISESKLPFVALEDAKKGIRSRKLIWVRRIVTAGRKFARYVKITPLLAEDAMEVLNVYVLSTDSIRKAMQLMLEYDVDGIPVKSPSGKVIGIICKNDLIRELARRARIKIPKKIEEVEKRELAL